ncbi:hypothetical protein [Fulvivirga sp.]|uniref:hypothetical protein n=1 Tax=Fulvivirga sp. TaxID=1931237 RepID=UPI0032EC4EDF
MKKQNITAIVFGCLLILIVIFEDYLCKKLWVLQPNLFSIKAVGCFFSLLNAVLRKNWKGASIIMLTCLIAMLIYLPRTELFKSKPVLEAVLIDDLNGIRMILRENKTFEIIPESWMGTFEIYTGSYKTIGTKIIFLDQPYDNDFIPDTVNVYKDKIILNGNINNPDTSFANHFTIHLNKLEKSK